MFFLRCLRKEMSRYRTETTIFFNKVRPCGLLTRTFSCVVFVLFFDFPLTGVLTASIEVIGIPKRVLTSPDLAAYVMSEGDDGEEGGRADVRNGSTRRSGDRS